MLYILYILWFTLPSNPRPSSYCWPPCRRTRFSRAMPRCRPSKSIKIWKNFSGPIEMKKLSWVLSKILRIGIKIKPLLDFSQLIKLIFNMMESNNPNSYRTGMGIAVPNILPLSDKSNYSYWRVLIKTYLDAIGLWSGNAPVDVSNAVYNMSLLSLMSLFTVSAE